jgi:hypothetical protein
MITPAIKDVIPRKGIGKSRNAPEKTGLPPSRECHGERDGLPIFLSGLITSRKRRCKELEFDGGMEHVNQFLPRLTKEEKHG